MTDRLAPLLPAGPSARPAPGTAGPKPSGANRGFSALLQQVNSGPQIPPRPAAPPAPPSRPSPPAEAARHRPSNPATSASSAVPRMGDTPAPKAEAEPEERKTLEKDSPASAPDPAAGPLPCMPGEAWGLAGAPGEAEEALEASALNVAAHEAVAAEATQDARGRWSGLPGAELPHAAQEAAGHLGLVASEAAAGDRPGPGLAAGSATGPGAFHTLLPSAATPGSAPGPVASPASLPADARIEVPPDSPRFGEAVASQLTYFLKEGVQQARLHLHPAELGPVSVQIAVQGTQAQVDFVAASAVTRAALEDSLAQLASALQAAGLTLTGGGVSHQAPQSDGGRQDGFPQGPAVSGHEGRDTTSDGRAGAGLLPLRPVAGRLDVYA